MGNVGEIFSFYCMKCKKKINTKIIQTKLTKRKTTLNRGICPNCGTKVCAISK